MRFEDICPFVRAAIIRNLSPEKAPQPTIAYDHRIFYVLSGSGHVQVEDTCVEAVPGTVMYWMSGTPYTLLPSKEGLQMIIINFDFLQDRADDVAAHPPVLPQNFESEKLLEQISFSNAPMLNKPLLLCNLPSVLPYLQSMLQEADIPTIWGNFQLSSLLRVVLTAMCRADTYTTNGKRSTDSFQRLLHYIHDHYTEPLSNASLAKRFNYHPNYISQLFTQHTGVSLHQYLLRIRVRQALYLLQTTELPISEVAIRSGFGNVSYFCQYFKKSTGYSPSSFRL
jgi:AraC-like DNA-binding protein